MLKVRNITFKLESSEMMYLSTFKKTKQPKAGSQGHCQGGQAEMLWALFSQTLVKVGAHLKTPVRC